MSTPEQPNPGPCTPWVTAEDVAATCDALSGSDVAVYDDAALMASEVLFALSGRQFTGECETVVRPCTGSCDCWPDSWTYGWPGQCGWLHRLTLSGYPVREVTEVKIDGDVIDPATYRLDGRRYLARLDDVTTGAPQRWPACQHLGRPDTDEGTFSVAYSYGQDPPLLGQQAAAELACQIAPATAAGADCDLPAGVTKVTRQGIELDLKAVQSGLTGLYLVDLFLRTYNPAKLTRRPAVWSPDLPAYPQRLG